MKTWHVCSLAVVGGVGLIFGLSQFDSAQSARQQAYQNSPEARAEAARQAEQGDIEAAEMIVQMRLRDPDSATFVGAKEVRSGSTKVVCGFVNAKNGFGGMAGEQWFAVTGTDVILAGDGPKALGKINRICGA